MRIVKDPDVRKNEILDCAESLFATKGYMQTTVNDVLNSLGIAKGTFYHYFKSKEQVMEAVVMRYMERGVTAFRAISEDPNLKAAEKLRLIICGSGHDNDFKDQAIEQFHQAGNAEMHQMSLVETVRQLSPILGDIIKQGVEEGSFKNALPYETAEFLLAGSQFLLDMGLFHWSAQELIDKAKALSKIMEILLQAQAGTFDYIYTRYEEMLNNQKTGKE